MHPVEPSPQPASACSVCSIAVSLKTSGQSAPPQLSVAVAPPSPPLAPRTLSVALVAQRPRILRNSSLVTSLSLR